jgi:hypothetical protein
MLQDMKAHQLPRRAPASINKIARIAGDMANQGGVLLHCKHSKHLDYSLKLIPLMNAGKFKSYAHG